MYHPHSWRQRKLFSRKFGVLERGCLLGVRTFLKRTQSHAPHRSSAPCLPCKQHYGVVLGLSCPCCLSLRLLSRWWILLPLQSHSAFLSCICFPGLAAPPTVGNADLQPCHWVVLKSLSHWFRDSSALSTGWHSSGISQGSQTIAATSSAHSSLSSCD